MRERDYPTLSSAPVVLLREPVIAVIILLRECRFIVAETSYQMVEILLLFDRERS